jgi:hypothetical protein
VQRRRLLVLVPLTLAGCVTSARDESGPRNPPTTPDGGDGGTDDQRQLQIVGAEVAEADDGSFVLSVTVANRAADRRSDTLVGTATVDGTEYEATEDVSLPGESEATVDLRFGVAYSDWEGGGSLSYGWEGAV